MDYEEWGPSMEFGKGQGEISGTAVQSSPVGILEHTQSTTRGAGPGKQLWSWTMTIRKLIVTDLSLPISKATTNKRFCRQTQISGLSGYCISIVTTLVYFSIFLYVVFASMSVRVRLLRISNCIFLSKKWTPGVPT